MWVNHIQFLVDYGGFRHDFVLRTLICWLFCPLWTCWGELAHSLLECEAQELALEWTDFIDLLGEWSLGERSLGKWSLGKRSRGERSLGERSLGERSLGE